MPSSDTPKVCWDTCIVLDALLKRRNADGTPTPDYQAADEQLFEAAADRQVIVVSTVTITEIQHLNGDSGEAADGLLRSFFDNRYMRVFAVDDEIAETARDLMRIFPLGIADAIIIATSSVVGCPILFTKDGIGKNNKKPMLDLCGKVTFSGLVGAASQPMRIVQPTVYRDELKAKEMSAQIAASEASTAKNETGATGGKLWK